MIARWEGVQGRGEKEEEIKIYTFPVIKTVMGM